MLGLESGEPIALIKGGVNNSRIICIDDKKKDGHDELELADADSELVPMMNCKERGIYYIAGPSGSGKSTYAANLMKFYKIIYPKSEIYLFSRTNYKNDPAFKGMSINQVKLNEDLLEDKIDIEKEIPKKSILFFDDCNTLQNGNMKKYMECLMSDVMEVGRKLELNIIITNHLIIPNDRNFARTIMNELQYLTVFPRSGSTYQITYVLKNYFGLSKRQISRITQLDTRWVTIKKSYPMAVMYEKGVFTL